MGLLLAVAVTAANVDDASAAPAAQARLQATQQEVKALIAGDRFQAAADKAEQLVGALEGEAAADGLDADLSKFRASCRFLAELATQAGNQDPKP
jgi:hypothetical protein